MQTKIKDTSLNSFGSLRETERSNTVVYGDEHDWCSLRPILRQGNWTGSDEIHTRATDCSTKRAPSYKEEAPPELRVVKVGGMQRYSPLTIEPASIDPNHNRQRGIFISA